MTAEGTACNGAGEAPNAELAAAKGAVAATPPGERPAEEREGEGVGGSFVIVNGDSDGLSDRGSDLDQRLNEDPPSDENNHLPSNASRGRRSRGRRFRRGSNPDDRSDEDSPSDEDDQPPSNAGPDAAAGGAHGAADGELGVSGAALSASSAEGHDRAAAEYEDGVGEGKGEHSADFVAELVEQETASVEQGGAEALAAIGIDHADTGADSAVPAVYSEVNGKESTREESTAAGVAELLAHDAATEEQDGADAAVESSGRKDALTHAESGSTTLDEVCGEESKGEQSTFEVMEPVELGTDGSGALMVNGHHDADSCVTATEPVSPANEGNQEQGAANVTELVEQDAACGEQDDALQANGHDHLDRSADSCTSSSEFKAHADESKGQQSGQQEGAPTAETEVSEGMLDASSSDCGAYTCEEPIEEEVVANGHGYAEDNADASLELEPGIEEGEGEATLDVPQLEDQIDKDSEGNLCDGNTADAVFSYKDAKPPMKEGINEAVPAVAGLDVMTENKSEEIVQGDELVKNDVSVGILHSVKPESDPFIESSGDQKVQVDVALGDENTVDSDVKADNMVEMNTSDNVQTQELRTAVEDRSIPLHVNSSGEVEEKELTRPPCPQEAKVAQSDDSSVQTGKHEQLEAPSVGLADKSDNGVVEADPRKEVEMEVVDAVPLQAAAVSTFNNEPRPIDLVDNDSIKHSSLDQGDHILTEECRSREISSTTVDQVISGASMEHGTAVADDAELSSETGDESQEKPSETAVDQGEPVSLNEDEAVAVDHAQPSSATRDESAVVGEVGDISQKDESSNLGADSKSHKYQSEIRDTSTTHDELSSTGDKGSSPINELASSIEEPCPSDVTLEPEVKAPCTDKETCPSDDTGRDICFGNVNAHTKSSDEVETKCLEALEPSSIDTVALEEHKNDDEHAHADEVKIVEDFSESHVDLGKSNKGDTQVIRQQRIYLIKVPKFAGEDLWAKTQDAQVHMDRLTQERDAINFRKQKQKAVCDEYREKVQAARQEEREARAAHGDKNYDLNIVRSMIGKLNKANSIEEIDEMIARKEKIMEHETISLKEEKLFIKEINELKAQRKQLCSNMGSKAEINEAFHQKDHIHEQHKTLKKDSDVLFNNLKSLEENTRKIQKSYDDERTVLRNLNDEFRAANEIRQKAYSVWVELRAEPVKKNKYFFMYKRDRGTASEYLSMGDMEGLQLYCNNQVERVLGMWNQDDNFRNLYVEANKFSTLRRLGTHDGRRLGPEEDPPVIPSNFNRRPSNPSPLTVSSPDVPILTSEVAPEKPVPVVVVPVEDSFPVLASPQISKRAKSKASGSSSQKETTTAPASEREDVKHIEKESARLAEELELARKAEELARREEEREERTAAEKERLRLEQKAKAKEAEERKKRKAEKAQERAEFKARKEAEMKEKKRTKKDKRNGAKAADSASGSGEGNSTAIATTDTDSSTSESTRDAEVSQQTAPRRTSRPAAAMRQLNRVQPMPLPLRNRGRRKMRQYILVAVAVLSVIALIVAGSYTHLPSLRSLHF